MLIRPDGYVGLISDTGDVSAVSDYFAAIGGAVFRRSRDVAGRAVVLQSPQSRESAGLAEMN